MGYLQQDLQSPLQHSAHLSPQHFWQEFLDSPLAAKVIAKAAMVRRIVFIGFPFDKVIAFVEPLPAMRP